jgi:hypothetical protein
LQEINRQVVTQIVSKSNATGTANTGDSSSILADPGVNSNSSIWVRTIVDGTVTVVLDNFSNRYCVRSIVGLCTGDVHRDTAAKAIEIVQNKYFFKLPTKDSN